MSSGKANEMDVGSEGVEGWGSCLANQMLHNDNIPFALFLFTRVCLSHLSVLIHLDRSRSNAIV